MMEFDGYWMDVEKEYRDSIMEGVKLSDDERWEYAKEMVRDRYLTEYFVDKATRAGKDYWDGIEEKLVERRRIQEFMIN
jgi:hypothetical protein